MDFVLTLHGHLPYVLHHGRWPHGSVWLCEGALDSYLPLIEALQALEREHIAAPITLGITPVLANQLAHPSFVSEFETYMERRLESAAHAPASLAQSGDLALKPIADFWQRRLQRLYNLFRSLDDDLIGTLRGFEARGVIDIISSAATHGFLPLLARDESIRLQLHVGASEHQRLFGRAPTGCWLPECAYRPAGPWNPGYGAPVKPYRVGIEQHLAAAGYHYFFVDSHLVHGGPALGYPDAAEEPLPSSRSPYTAYRVASADGNTGDLFALVRDPRSSRQVWSRAQGYPGDEWYLEFHKIRWPDGLRLWRVTGPQVDLGAKRQYDPEAAQTSARNHADHFASVLRETAATRARGKAREGVVTAPFDAELFGHWWFEGVDFLANVYRRLTIRQPGHGNGSGRSRTPTGPWRLKHSAAVRRRARYSPRRLARCCSRKALIGNSSSRPAKPPTTRTNGSTSIADRLRTSCGRSPTARSMMRRYRAWRRWVRRTASSPMSCAVSLPLSHDCAAAQSQTRDHPRSLLSAAAGKPRDGTSGCGAIRGS